MNLSRQNIYITYIHSEQLENEVLNIILSGIQNQFGNKFSEL